MADVSMNGRGFAPQAGSYQAYQSYQQHQPGQSGDPRYVQPHAVPEPSGNPVKAMAALTGAGLSVALLIGVGVWSYQLISRDVAGVPVVRAVQGEMRIRPAVPGGAQALNQGLAVNAVAAAGGTAGPSERIVLAPEPIKLDGNDAPLIDQLVAAQPRFAAPKQAPSAAPVVAPESASPAEPENPQMASIEALAAQIAAGATPLTTQGQVTTPPAQTAPQPRTQAAPAARTITLSPDAISTDTPGVALSLRPKNRPDGVRTASLTAQGTTGGLRDVDPATIPAGTRLVQLGAYESPEIARREWERFSTRFADYMQGKDRVVQRATSGGRTFFRLRAMGFEDLADARRFCSALTAQNTDCIPVVTR